MRYVPDRRVAADPRTGALAASVNTLRSVSVTLPKAVVQRSARDVNFSSELNSASFAFLLAGGTGAASGVLPPGFVFPTIPYGFNPFPYGFPSFGPV